MKHARLAALFLYDMHLRTPLRIEFAKPSAKQSGNMYAGQ
jgi:hypothetical protein